MVGSVEAKTSAKSTGQRDESAFNMFKQMDLKGRTKDDTQLNTVHQNTISTLREHEISGSRVGSFTSKDIPQFWASQD